MQEIEEVKDKETDIIYFVKAGESMSSIADKFKTTIETIIRDNDIKEVSEGDILWIRKKNTCIYVVKPLDTLSKVAKSCSVSESHIRKLNDLKTDKLFVGQKLII